MSSLESRQKRFTDLRDFADRCSDQQAKCKKLIPAYGEYAVIACAMALFFFVVGTYGKADKKEDNAGMKATAYTFGSIFYAIGGFSTGAMGILMGASYFISRKFYSTERRYMKQLLEDTDNSIRQWEQKKFKITIDDEVTEKHIYYYTDAVDGPKEKFKDEKLLFGCFGSSHEGVSLYVFDLNMEYLESLSDEDATYNNGVPQMLWRADRHYPNCDRFDLSSAVAVSAAKRMLAEADKYLAQSIVICNLDRTNGKNELGVKEVIRTDDLRLMLERFIKAPENIPQFFSAR